MGEKPFGMESLSEHDPASAEFRRLRTHHCNVAECEQHKLREDAMQRQGKKAKRGD